MGLEYLTITAYTDETYSSSLGSYPAMINPDKYTQNHTIDYNTEQAPGTSGTTIKFHNMGPRDVSFELIIDVTGVVPGSPTDLKAEITKLTNLVYTYNGTIHSPNYLFLNWGTAFTFYCRLTSMTVNYTLFKTDGSPLRAKLNLSFKEYKSALTIAREENNNSPDLTHVRTVVAGDTLPDLTYKIYGDKSPYLKVAAFNKIDNFRRLKPGMQIKFPPLI